ncbi:hypothetical protein ACFQWB_16630 [Paenibacillus thermoaerophilus]|uniref:Uncharacterized protein n=1 Tax=Paenibacillus thermoaerophilus TaxID=1215385 RepID=A0ABW2V5W5_9BACL|nr:hypothetical protein [Paenibacillus thermoaerophilus]TMV07299.1 hypothetical protein FE781_16040 [Paenibacillus thermoaerophilus]
MFYDAEGEIGGIRRNRGHVGLSLGDGRVIHAWDRVRIDECRAVSELAPAPGWTRPAPAGWVPAETVLRGSRAKEWD